MRHGPTGKILGLSVDISVLEQRGHCWTGVLPPVVPILGTLAGAPELHVHPVLLRLKRQRRHWKRPNSYDSCGWKWCKEVTTTRQLIRKCPRSEVVSSLTQKGVFDAIHRNESAALSMQDKRSAVEGLALREAIGRTRTLLRWGHREANVVDALTKVDNRAHELLRKFLQSRVWRICVGP